MKKRRKKRCRIANKKRFVTFCTICILMLISIFNLASASAVKNIQTVTVSSGDTLWSIAAEANTSGKDIRSVIDDIMLLNDLSQSSLVRGQQLIVPVY